MGKLTISMAMFNSYVSLPEGSNSNIWPNNDDNGTDNKHNAVNFNDNDDHDNPDNRDNHDNIDLIPIANHNNGNK